MKLVLNIFLSFLFISSAYSQTEGKSYVRKGNKYYQNSDFKSAESYYEKALEKSPNYFKAGFNKGNTIYRQEKYEDAAKHFGNLADAIDNKVEKAYAYHNQGNSFLQIAKVNAEKSNFEGAMGDLKQGINSYKNALRNNHRDNATRYNLAFAQKILKEMDQKNQQQQDQGQDQKQNKDQQQQQNDQQQNQKKDKDQKQDQDQQQQENQNPEQDQQQQQAQPNQMSKEQAKKILDALNLQEKKLQEKINKKKEKGIIIGTQKDW